MEINKSKGLTKELTKELGGFPVLTSEDLRIVLLELLNTIFWCWLYFWSIINFTKIVLGIATKML